MNKSIILGALALVLVGAGGWYFTQQGPRQDIVLENVERVDIPDMVLGSAEAPVEVIEYASFTCPHCADFHRDVFPKVKTDYIDTGKVRFILREAYFDTPGLWASMVARCDGGLRYFGLARLLFERRDHWAERGLPGDEVIARIKTIGRSGGLTDEQMDTCLDDEAKSEKLNQWYEANFILDKIEGTPSFLINGKFYENMFYDDFARIVDAELNAPSN